MQHNEATADERLRLLIERIERLKEARKGTKMQHNEATADERLRLLIERIERLEEEKKIISDDIKGRLPRDEVHRLRRQGDEGHRAPPQARAPRA
jgi:uncharacterized protein (UPF0335 family)